MGYTFTLCEADFHNAAFCMRGYLSHVGVILTNVQLVLLHRFAPWFVHSPGSAQLHPMESSIPWNLHESACKGGSETTATAATVAGAPCGARSLALGSTAVQEVRTA